MDATNQRMRCGSETTARLMAYGIAAGFCVVSLIANVSFAMSVAATPLEKVILVAMAVLLDLFKGTALVLAFRLWQRRRRALAVATVVLGLGSLTWSSVSALGFVATTRSNTAAVRASILEQQSAWMTTVRRADERLVAINSTRPVSVIEADIAAQVVPPHVWARTRECGPTLAKLHVACAPILRLRRELAGARAAERLEAQINDTRKQLAELAIVASSDPQVAALSRIFGATELALRDALAIVLAALLEAGSALGFAIARGASKPNPPSASHTSTNNGHRHPTAKLRVVRGGSSDRTHRATAQHNTHHQRIERWVAVSISADTGAEIPARAAYVAFCGWAQRNGIAPCTETTFGTAFTGVVAERGGRKDVRRSGRYYTGVRLRDMPHSATVMRAAA